MRTILADKVDLAEYAKNWTIFALFSAVGFSIGPVAGGYLTRVSWRWCFGINLPVGVLAVVMGVVLLRGELLGAQELPELGGKPEGQRRSRDKTTKRGRFLLRLATIDYGGQALFLWGFGLLVLGMTWAGGMYAWGSANVVAPLVVGVVLTVGWLAYEYSMAPGRLMARVFPIQRAMMPWELLSQRDIGLLFVVNFTVGAAIFAVMYFMDIYFALVLGHDPEKAGLTLLFFLPGLGGEFLFLLFYFLFLDRPRLTMTSWCLHVNVLHQRLATADPPVYPPRVRHRSRRHHGPRLGHICRERQPHLWHDGADGPRCRHALQPRRSARPGLLPDHDGPDYLSCNFCPAIWWHYCLDHHVHRLQ